MPQIQFNGKTYNDTAEMPATERQMYEQLMSVMRDEDGNGIPDILEGDVVGNIIDIVKKSGGGIEGVAALEQISPEMRARISKGVAKLQEFGLLAGMSDLPQSSQASPSWEDAEIRASEPIISSPSAIQEDSGLSRAIVLVVVWCWLLAFSEQLHTTSAAGTSGTNFYELNKESFTPCRFGYHLSVSGHLCCRGSGVYHFWAGLIEHSSFKPMEKRVGHCVAGVAAYIIFAQCLCNIALLRAESKRDRAFFCPVSFCELFLMLEWG